MDKSCNTLIANPHAGETLEAIRKATQLASDPNISACPETVEKLGGGWVGEEALAISIYCSLVAKEDFARGVLLAVNHSGDSDSTGAITGNILGALLGSQQLPLKWLNQLELRDVIERVATDLFIGFSPQRQWTDSYPGY
uniref:ADP-ribosylglycohydrolase n=1 Tax=Citrifermentans bremense TaxID=60035 RepID=A0A6S6M922_9BACT